MHGIGEFAEGVFQQFGIAVAVGVASNRVTVWYYKHFRKIDLRGDRHGKG